MTADTNESRCPNGHANPDGFEFCGVCGQRISGSDGDDPSRSGRRSRTTALLVGGAISLLAVVVGVAVASSRGGESDQASTPNRIAGTSQTGAPTYEDIDFGTCSDPSDPSVPPEARLLRGGAVVTDSFVLLAVETEADPPNRDPNVRADEGDWDLAVTLELWEKKEDRQSRLYTFVVGAMNFGGLDSTTRGKGLIDPSAITYLRDGRYFGALIDRKALSALDDVKGLAFVAEGTPSRYEENQVIDDNITTSGWTTRGNQWCPDDSSTIAIPGFG